LNIKLEAILLKMIELEAILGEMIEAILGDD